jgi:hypothetical protein
MALALLMSSSVCSGVLMTGFFALVVLALVVLGFLVVGSSLSEVMVGEEEAKVAEEEEGECSCLRFLVVAVEGFLVVVGMAWEGC